MKNKLLVLFTVWVILLLGCGAEQVAMEGETAVSAPPTSSPIAPDVTPSPTTGAPTGESMSNMGSETVMGDSMMGENIVASSLSQVQEVVTTVASESELSGSEVEGLAIQLAVAQPEVAAWLVNYPDWTGNAWVDSEDGRFYSVDFYSETADEWLGWVYVDVVDQVVTDFFVPRELTAEEFQAGLEKVEQFVMQDGEVLTRLGNTASWEHETSYNRWDAEWVVWFWYGLDELAVTVDFWEDEPYLVAIENPNEFDAQTTLENNRNQAIELAWQGEGIDQALAGVDNWQTFVSHQGGSIWAVTFATEERELYYALVDIENWNVLENE